MHFKAHSATSGLLRMLGSNLMLSKEVSSACEAALLGQALFMGSKRSSGVRNSLVV